MANRRHIGNIIVDSASFWIGDPIYVDCGTKTVSDWCGKEYICKADTSAVDGITGYTADGDGEFPVYAEYDSGGNLLRIILEFDEE